MSTTTSTTDPAASDFPASWKPTTVGEGISGRVVSIDARDGGYGLYPIVTLEDEGGTRLAVHAFHTVLRKQLARCAPKVGDSLEITYLGRTEPQDGKKGYANYRTTGGDVTGGGAGYDWASELVDDAQSQAPVGLPIVPEPAPAPVPVDDDSDSLPF